jgi:hypothetical protein
VQIDDHKSGQVRTTLVDYDTSNDKTTISTIPTGSSDLHRRDDINDYVAYYSYFGWDSELVEQFPASDEAHEIFARETLEFAIENDLAGFCLNLGLPDFQGGVQAVSTGFFAFSPGTFVDYSPNCG